MVNLFSVVLVVIGTFMGAIGAVVIKKGTNANSLLALVRGKDLWAGVFLYGISSVFYIIAL